MTEKDSPSQQLDWASAWLRQQAELLRSSAAAPHGGRPGSVDDTLHAVGDHWLEMGKAYLASIQHTAGMGGEHGEAGTSEAPFRIGEELMNLWRGAWTTVTDAQAGAGPQLSDLLARLPPIGIAREHSETWRELLAAQAECQRLEQELRAVLAGVQADALDLLRERLHEREQQQRPLTQYRELYDLWVECGEQVYAKVAHSAAYAKLQAELGNAAMRVRTHQQKVLEQSLKQFDLPTRSELNTVHRQLREQREQLRELRELIAARATPGEMPASDAEKPRARSTSKAGPGPKPERVEPRAKARHKTTVAPGSVAKATAQTRPAGSNGASARSARAAARVKSRKSS
ncbi:MAG TPA: poly(R)-hydroxyalkanoic acid synthase subunit PhaE [Steroidobacteraceae bacterium]|jgi:hypothetical protein